MKVYLAGKIEVGKNATDWRSELLSSINDSLNDDCIQDPSLTLLNVVSEESWNNYIQTYHSAFKSARMNFSLSKRIDYCGPFYEDLTGHGGGNHSVFFEDELEEKSKKELFLKCLNAISQCDIFFLWIDSLDCYGSLIELGYAKALDKFISIGICDKLIKQVEENDPSKDDLWFLKECISKVSSTVKREVFSSYSDGFAKSIIGFITSKSHTCASFRPVMESYYESARSESGRKGQSLYRKSLLTFWEGKCSVTGCTFEDVLRASHIKPFCVSNTDEEYDLYNGFLLIPNLDILFDRGFISFDKQGKIIISKEPDEVTLKTLGVTSSMKLRKITDQHNVYLDYHLNHVFKP